MFDICVQIALEILENEKQAINFEQLTHREDVSKVSIVGAGMVNNPGVAAKMFEALYDSGINIHMISTSETKVSVLINITKPKLLFRLYTTNL